MVRSFVHLKLFIDIIPAVSTGHSAIFMKISPVRSAQRGPSHWKFNNSLILDSIFVEMLRKEITAVLKHTTQVHSVTQESNGSFSSIELDYPLKNMLVNEAKRGKNERGPSV